MAETQPEFVEKLFSVKDRTVLQKGCQAVSPNHRAPHLPSPSPSPLLRPMGRLRD